MARRARTRNRARLELDHVGPPSEVRRRIGPAIRKLRPEFSTWLDSLAIEFLEKHVPELERAGLLSAVDGPGLSLLADRYTEVLAWRELIHARGMERAQALGYVTQFRRAEESFRHWAAEYGLTALSRTRLAQRDNGLGDDDESDLDAM